MTLQTVGANTTHEFIVEAGYVPEFGGSLAVHRNREIAEGIDGITMSTIDPTFMEGAERVAQALNQLNAQTRALEEEQYGSAITPTEHHDPITLGRNAVERSLNGGHYPFILVTAQSPDDPAIEKFKQRRVEVKRKEIDEEMEAKRIRKAAEVELSADVEKIVANRRSPLRRALGRVGVLNK